MGHGLNKNGTLFLASLYHQGQENTSPLQFGFEKSMEGVLVKVEDTHQEEVLFQEGGPSQVTMAAPMSDEIA